MSKISVFCLKISVIVTVFLFCKTNNAQHTSFRFNNFNAVSANNSKHNKLFLQHAATTVQVGSHSVVQLTNHSNFMQGRAMYSLPIPMKTNDNKTLVSFSTTFVFSMVPPPQAAQGNGMAFFFSPTISAQGTLTAEFLGLLNLTTNNSSSHLFAVEFDTTSNPEFLDPDDNHVGVDINTLISNPVHTAGYFYGQSGEQFAPIDLNNGRNIQAWIDYNATKQHLTVAVMPVGKPKPARPLLSVHNPNLESVFEDKMYVGISASTGNSIEDHYILAWSFATDGPSEPLDLSSLPSLQNLYATNRKSNKVLIFIVAAACVLVVLLVLWLYVRIFYPQEKIEEWEKEFWPHRFSYKELTAATQGFNGENLLGSGGFGKVYKGILGREIAVKCITKELKEGMKGFVAEITSMGRLQHRNLVQLKGWCRLSQKLLIVYDYMPNGSLDRWVFGGQGSVLTWEKRYSILRDVTEALLYLHEGWEKCVIHRDIKASNVLLDSELNGRLSDFGLAKLYEHNENPQTTQVVGTLGYIAPELIHTGKAATASDVFALGCLFLEVACGRKPVDPRMDEERVVLVDFVAQLLSDGQLLQAADPQLRDDYDVKEMECVLNLGLMCSHPRSEARPKTRHVAKILKKEMPLPLVECPLSTQVDFDMFMNRGALSSSSWPSFYEDSSSLSWLAR